MAKKTDILKLCILLPWSLLPCLLKAQTIQMTLDDVIAVARSQSPQYKMAETQRKTSYYEYLMYKSDLNPQLSLTGNLPTYNKEYFGVRQPDGTIRFQSISQNYSTAGLGISQQIPFTGGQLSVNTNLTRFDDFQLKTREYNGTPVYIQLSQPLFAYNELKWQRRIEPLKFQESRAAYYLEMENIAQQAVGFYFDILDAQYKIANSRANLIYAEANYAIEKKRVDLGTTTEDKLLQLELQVLNNKQSLQVSQYEYRIAQLRLRTFTGRKDSSEVHLLPPPPVADLDISMPDAIAWARKYRPEFITFERKRLEAMRDVAQAKSAQQEVNLVASYGLNNVGPNPGSVYSNPKEQQRVNVSFNIPIVDWGRRKARLNTTRSAEQLVAYTNEMEESQLVQEIQTIVQNFGLLKENIKVNIVTDSVAQRRFNIANSLFQTGKITATDLNIAQTEKDNAQRNLTEALKQYWAQYYLLRKLTLYDFEKRTAIIPSL